MESSFLTRHQALSLWSGSTDSKTLNYHRTNPREYQIELTQRKPLEYKTHHHATTSNTQCRTSHLNNKPNKNTNQNISKQDYHFTQRCPSEEKQTKTQHKSHPIKAYTNHWNNLRKAETKRKKKIKLLQGKNSTLLEIWEKETSNTIS